MSKVQAVVLALLIPLVLGAAYLIGRGGDDEPSSSVQVERADGETEFEYDFVIPLGTADRIAAGEEIEIVPAELIVEVGDAIRIVNEDDEDHIVGVFFVASGETLTQRFISEAVLEGTCSVHPSGNFVLRVVEPTA